MKGYYHRILLTGIFLMPLMACNHRGNVGEIQSYPIFVESAWIRNGEPIEFENELWYPQDGIETLLDSEVYLSGEFKGVQFFIERVDVRPYQRIYTKFGRNKFRYYEKQAKP